MLFPKKFIFLFSVTVYFIIPSLLIAEEASSANKHPRALLKDSLDFLRDSFKDSNFFIQHQDLKLIKREKNTFFVPRHLRLKAIASIPLLEKDVSAELIKFTHPGNRLKTKGVRIVRIDQKSVLSKIGIFSKDIIHKVNDQVIEGNKSATEIFNTVKSSDIIKLSLIRDNQTLDLVYRFI